MLHHVRWSSIVLLILLGAGVARARVQYVERPDEMEVYFLADVDRLGDRVRVLYQTKPSLQQQVADPDGWTVNVYVAELHPDGSVKQRRLASQHRHFGALMLRRGHEEVFAIQAPGAPGSGTKQPLEVWSAQDGAVRFKTEVAVLPKVELGFDNIGTTDDGNVFVVDVSAHESRGRGAGIVWYKLSPRGEILGTASFESGGATVGHAGVFAARDGGVGLTVRATVSRDAPRLETDIENPVRRPSAEGVLEAEVHSETRLLVTDSSGKLRWRSAALERTFMWKGAFEVGSEVPAEQRMRLVQEHMRQQEEIGLQYGARFVKTRPDATSGAHLVRSTAAGYAVLADKAVRRDRVPPAHGPYFLEIGLDGKVRRELYLGSLAEQIGARDFDDFLPAADGSVLLAGLRTPEGSRDRQFHVTRVAADGSPNAIVSLGSPEGKFEGIAGTATNVWLIGHKWSDRFSRTLLRAEQVDMSAAEPLRLREVPAPAAKKKREIAATPAPTPVREAKPPQPTGDCNCSCEEFAELRTMLEDVGKMSDADKMKMATDPAYLKRMDCASQCGVAYSQCGLK